MTTRQEPGDETRYRGDFLPATNNASVPIGTPVERDANGKIQPLSEGGNYFGVLYSHGEAGSNTCTVRSQGPIVAFVDSGVTADTYLGSPATSASPAENAAAFGTADDQGVYALEDAADPEGNGNYYADVLLR
jgi:hypothetical protein